MSPKLLLVDAEAIQGDLESLAAFCDGQRDLLMKVAGLCSTDSLIPASDVARAFEGAGVWAAELADRLNQANEAIFSQVTLIREGRA